MKEYTYMPEVRRVFRCTVPNGNIRQIFLIDGILQEEENETGGILLQRGVDQMGLRLRINGDHSQEPIQIISVRSENLHKPLEFSNQWELAPGAAAQIIVCDHTLNEYLYRTSRFSQIKVGKEARLDILFMQNEHDRSKYWLDISAEVEEASQLDCHILSLYGGIIHNKVHVCMQQPGAVCNLDGLYLADGEQDILYDITVRHDSPGCNSRQLFKGILDNHARASFNGAIRVAPGAQKTEAYQANHNLLLTRNARITTKPQLEIYADDVKCSHGATIGRLDELGLFYLRSRGIPLAEAQMLQQMAFVQDVLDRVRSDAIRSRLERMVESRLRGEFTKCSHCTMHCC
ncbi:MAG: Fe-S cluster assembly protein SufD [Bacteroidales bacterium]|jgi:Fe-S cluster assembly protein SufD|nr:Fe-S cluster assembly protein SufD [Bacteroidales bacterium]MDD2263372.1 Fe-S cluster assembly protein SufD [Bacteroidales bacterium]MDD2830838.1 Fe-S cluster assembly protein SufD [Bacteroidales bacterium]MDD3208037.1 Fe-S cluster assembly protein SufD [Bacteroidales bacterium]MDD3696456.1 Fe-S cluster assembly protein SufD [Bacteroidales bacterium]